MIVENISALYPGSCNAPASCACQGGQTTQDQTQWTSWTTRVARFGGSAGAEIIASPSDPVSALRLWLSSNAGHREAVLTRGGSLGYGVDGYSTGDFGGSVNENHPIPSGAHYPRAGASVELWANWYDGAPPSNAQVNVDGQCFDMVLSRGTEINGAWKYAATGLSGCVRYYFMFKNSAGVSYHYPSSGSFGIGDPLTCADWEISRPSAGAGCSP